MNKTAIFWFSVGAIACAVMFQGEIIQFSEALYAVPPTVAFKTIQLNDTLLTQGDQINATSYMDKLHIITDGSIIIERGVGGIP